MPLPASVVSLQQPLQSRQINNENNSGIIGDGSNNNVNSWNNNQFNQFNQFHIIPPEDEEVELDRLLDGHVSKDAPHYSFYSRHPNTRTTVRNEIGKWIDEEASKKSPLLWLNGPAAVGKSVIAKTISGFHDHIVATFFFSSSSNRTAATLFPTLAWQLARRIPDTRKYIITSLKKSGSIPTTIEEQFNWLIFQPLQNIATTKFRPVMVIDGVDECIDESMLVRFLQVLVRAAKGGGMPVRFIICSRPERRIGAMLGRADDGTPRTNERELLLLSALHKVQDVMRPSYRPRSEAYLSFTRLLQDIRELYQPIRLSVDKAASSSPDTSEEHSDTLDKIYHDPVISTIQIGFSEECKQDIARYLEDTFNAIPQLAGSTGPQFTPSDISDLVNASCGQFLYATTIVRLLEDPDLDLEPREVFEMARRGSLPNPDLDKLYKAILKRAQDTIRKQAQKVGSNYQTEWRFVMDSLAILVFLAGNVHFFTVRKNFLVIESLLGLEWGKLTKKLATMRSILGIVRAESVHVHHLSFLEFLQNRERSEEYYISNSTALRRVLILMGRAGLRFNIFQDNDNGRLYIQDMTVACHRNFFERSRFPNVLDLLHYLIHLLMIIPLLLLFRALAPLTLSVPLLILRFFLGFFGTFIISLIAYVIFFDRSIIIPFFHPFLHPFFLVAGGFLDHSRLLCFGTLLLVEGLALLS